MAYKPQVQPDRITEHKQKFSVSWWTQEQRYWQNGEPIKIPRKLFSLQYYEIQSLSVMCDTEKYFIANPKIQYGRLHFELDLKKIRLPLGKCKFTLCVKRKNGKGHQNLEFTLTNFVPPSQSKKGRR